MQYGFVHAGVTDWHLPKGRPFEKDSKRSSPQTNEPARHRRACRLFTSTTLRTSLSPFRDALSRLLHGKGTASLPSYCVLSNLPPLTEREQRRPDTAMSELLIVNHSPLCLRPLVSRDSPVCRPRCAIQIVSSYLLIRDSAIIPFPFSTVILSKSRAIVQPIRSIFRYLATVPNRATSLLYSYVSFEASRVPFYLKGSLSAAVSFLLVGNQ